MKKEKLDLAVCCKRDTTNISIMSWMGANSMKFGEYFKSRRIELGQTLRQFCVNNGQDAAYISRLENGLMAAPSAPEKLRALARALKIESDSEAWVTFFDLAAISRREVPANISLDSPAAMELLPAFYRTLRNEPITTAEAEKLLKLIKGQNSDNETRPSSD
jgi:transcriptional regulator with XRE-family HTH domain